MSREATTIFDGGMLTPCPGRFAATPSLVAAGNDMVCYATVRLVPEFEEQTRIDAPCNILELSNGDWLWGCERWKGWDDTSPVHIRGFALRSTDGVRTRTASTYGARTGVSQPCNGRPIQGLCRILICTTSKRMLQAPTGANPEQAEFPVRTVGCSIWATATWRPQSP